MEEDMWHTKTSSDGLEIPASQALLVIGLLIKFNCFCIYLLLFFPYLIFLEDLQC
jgi:hypothetical protein